MPVNQPITSPRHERGYGISSGRRACASANGGDSPVNACWQRVYLTHMCSIAVRYGCI